LLYDASIKTAFFNFNINNLQYDEAWIKTISERIRLELSGVISHNSLSFFTEKSDLVKFLESNKRFVKISNFSVNSCINYTKSLLLESKGLKKKWVINSNNCAHKGRLDKIVTDKSFKIGGMEYQFPLQLFNVICDCTLDISDI
jgi:hypothetical protein